MSDEDYFSLAAEQAKKSLCLRDSCGAVIVQNGVVVGEGYNGPPRDDVEHRMCELDLRKSPKPKSDHTCCVHAEWRAIVATIISSGDLKGSALYFTRVDSNGSMLKSGEPYCTVCSRLALDAGISYFCLWHESGIKKYDTTEYNDASYQFHIKS